MVKHFMAWRSFEGDSGISTHDCAAGCVMKHCVYTQHDNRLTQNSKA